MGLFWDSKKNYKQSTSIISCFTKIPHWDTHVNTVELPWVSCLTIMHPLCSYTCIYTPAETSASVLYQLAVSRINISSWNKARQRLHTSGIDNKWNYTRHRPCRYTIEYTKQYCTFPPDWRLCTLCVCIEAHMGLNRGKCILVPALFISSKIWSQILDFPVTRIIVLNCNQKWDDLLMEILKRFKKNNKQNKHVSWCIFIPTQ